MLKFDFTTYTDTRLKAKYSFLLVALWLMMVLGYYLQMKMFYLIWIAVLVTVSAYMLYTQRIKLGFRNKCKAFSLNNELINFSFWGKKPDMALKLSQLEKIYFTELPRRGKKLDPFHFFLVFEFKKKELIQSTELPASKILDFLDDFDTFTKDNSLNLNIQNRERINELLGPELINLLQSLRQKPEPILR